MHGRTGMEDDTDIFQFANLSIYHLLSTIRNILLYKGHLPTLSSLPLWSYQQLAMGLCGQYKIMVNVNNFLKGLITITVTVNKVCSGFCQRLIIIFFCK